MTNQIRIANCAALVLRCTPGARITLPADQMSYVMRRNGQYRLSNVLMRMARNDHGDIPVTIEDEGAEYSITVHAGSKATTGADAEETCNEIARIIAQDNPSENGRVHLETYDYSLNLIARKEIHNV